MDTAFKKDTAGLRDGNGLICIKAILKYRHGSKKLKDWKIEILKNVTKPWTCEASRNHEVPWIILMRSQAVSLKSRGFPCPNKICDNPINNYICGNLWIKNVGGREMLKANGENVKSLVFDEKSWGKIW